MDRKPTRIHPSVLPREGRIVTFRDGPRLVPEYLVKFVTADSYPNLTFQEWVHKEADKKMESQVVGQALSLLRHSHFGR